MLWQIIFNDLNISMRIQMVGKSERDSYKYVYALDAHININQSTESSWKSTIYYFHLRRNTFSKIWAHIWVCDGAICLFSSVNDCRFYINCSLQYCIHKRARVPIKWEKREFTNRKLYLTALAHWNEIDGLQAFMSYRV